MVKLEDLTPAMRQWRGVKDLHPDKIVLFRMGDFFEMFGEDAREASGILEIALTTRERAKENPVPMCGIPYHALDIYLGKLLSAGRKVAVCDQVEDPSKAKGLVRREVTRVITPGTVLDDGVVAGSETVLLAAWNASEDRVGLAWADLSSGELRVLSAGQQEVLDRLSALGPKEILIAEGEQHPFQGWNGAILTPLPKKEFDIRRAREELSRRLGIPPSLPGLPPDEEALGALLAVTSYVKDVGAGNLGFPVWERGGSYLSMDEATRRNLELVSNIEDGGKRGTLFHVMDSCLSPMGSRLLREWILSPPSDRLEIGARQGIVSSWFDSPRALRSLREAMKGFPDLARVVARLAASIANPRDVGTLKNALGALPHIRSACLSAAGEAADQAGDLPDFDTLFQKLEPALLPTLPHGTKEGHIFSAGYSPELDHLRELAENARGAIISVEARERERTGISSLKIRYNRVFGYFIEISKSNLPRVPDDYRRRQTLAGGERFVTDELGELEGKILSAKERREELEEKLWLELLEEISPHLKELRDLASALARIDILASFASLALGRGYIRPSIVDEPVMDIKDGKHPVLECDPRHQPFVPNPLRCGAESESLLIITGPNMGGKSTYLRQAALLAIMSHLGSYIPATAATVGLCDRLFCRVGAGDSLLRGLSTFMVEMTETSAILGNATKHSLVLLDEVGRGTSTYDGLAIAWAVAEALSRDGGIGCRTLFATHYLELTKLGATRGGVKNYSMGVREYGGKVIFLKTVEEGAADRSYGIHVAELAGIPRGVVERAREKLAELEDSGDSFFRGGMSLPANRQPSLFESDPAEIEILKIIRKLEIDTITPIEALTLLATLKKQLTN